MSLPVRQSTRGSLAPPRFSRNARESMYPVPSNDFLNSLNDCVAATEGCAATLSSALDKFEPGVADLPRLKHIFEIHKGFLLMPEPMVLAKKSNYAASLQPYIDQLLDRAGELVAAEAGYVERLEEQLALLENARARRIPAAPRLPGTFKDLDVSADRSFLDAVDVQGVTPAQRRKMAMLRSKRMKLEKERARLMGEA